MGEQHTDITTTKCITLIKNSNGFVSGTDVHGTGLRKKQGGKELVF